MFFYCIISCAKEDIITTEVMADFSADTSLVIINKDVTFSDLSTGNPNSWLWSFEGGEPATSKEQNPTIKYSAKGKYNVSLKVSNEYSEDTILIEDYVSVINSLSANFTSDTTSIYTGSSIQFYDYSEGDATSWIWTFEGGEPSTSTEQNPIVKYSDAGNYNVSLIVSNEYSEDTIIIEDYVSVINSLSANFTSDTTSIYTGSSIQFYDSSEGDATSWLWTFEGGEPATSTEQNPTVKYFSAGEYDVSLVISNDYQKDTISMENYITVQEIIIPDEFNIVGTWELIESNDSDLYGMQVTVNDEETEAEIIYSPCSTFSIGDLKWRNLEKTSEHEYSYNERTPDGTYSNDYSIFIVANGNELIIGNFTEYTAGSFQRWKRVDFQYPEEEDYDLLGTWERTKSNNSNLDNMLVTVNDSQTQGTIVYTPDETSFSVGDLKWINISKEDKNRYVFEDLVTNGNYTESRLFITANGKEFLIGVFSTNAGSFQKWTIEE